MNRWQAFLYGASRTFSLFPPPRSTYRIRDRDDAIAEDWRAVAEDWRAVAEDWRAVDDDLRKAMKNLEGEHEQPDTLSS